MTTTDPSVPAQPATPGQALARLFHETYERLAPEYGYRTREASAKPWEEVPEQNRALMVATCKEVLRRWADELDAGSPACHQPGVQPDWCGYLTHEAATRLREAGLPTLAGHVEDLERAHAAGNPEHLYGPRPGPLSSAPPAGTEAQ